MPTNDLLLSRIFCTLFKKIHQLDIEKSSNDDLENKLKEVVLNVLGNKVYSNYLLFIKKDLKTFDYYNEVSKLFENIIINYKKQEDILNYIEKYNNDYYKELDNYKYASILLKNVYRLYSNNKQNVIILKFDDCYRVDPLRDPDTKNPNLMPSIYIDNIANLDRILEEYVLSIKDSKKSFYNKIFISPDDLSEETLSNIFYFTLLNITTNETRCLEEYFKKYISFLNDTTFDEYINSPKYIGNLAGDEVYLNVARKDMAYETPFWLSYIFKNHKYFLPLVGVGIYKDTNNKKVAEVIAIQDNQSIPLDVKAHDEMIQNIKKMSPKAHNFREHNPTHLLSIIFATGFFNGSGIKQIDINLYMPFRYQRLLNENSKTDEDIDNFEKRVTTKNIYTWMRMLEFTNDINVENYPDNGTFLTLKLNDDIIFNNDFFQNAYNLGFESGRNASIERDY